MKFGDKMPSQHLFCREIEVCSKLLRIDQKVEGDVHCVVWDAALVLSKFIENQSLMGELSLSGLNVLELGSGLGCVGLSAACLGQVKQKTKIYNLNFCSFVCLFVWHIHNITHML